MALVMLTLVAHLVLQASAPFQRKPKRGPHYPVAGFQMQNLQQPQAEQMQRSAQTTLGNKPCRVLCGQDGSSHNACMKRGGGSFSNTDVGSFSNTDVLDHFRTQNGSLSNT